MDLQRQKSVLVFQENTGVEALLCVEERFRAIARQLSFTDGLELFDNFEEVLTDSAEEKWLNLTVGVADIDRTPARFNEAMEAFCQRYVDAFARDAMIKYLPTIEKEVSCDIRTHVDRMETLCRYTNKLPGAEPILTEQQQKNIVFDAFPVDWRQSYIRVGKDLRADTMVQLIQFMSNEANFIISKKRPIEEIDEESTTKEVSADSEDESVESNESEVANDTDTESDAEEQHASWTHTNKRHKGPDPEDECPLHGGHMWRKCFENQWGDNFCPRFRNGNHESHFYQHDGSSVDYNFYSQPERLLQNSANQANSHHIDGGGPRGTRGWDSHHADGWCAACGYGF